MSKFSVGDKVRRNTSEAHYATEVGEVIEINALTMRARVKWTDKRTWYSLAKLLPA
jgi:hypothetical protein